MEKKWVLVFMADDKYMDLAYETIHMARDIGKWTDDIVILCPPYILDNPKWIVRASQYNVTYKVIEEHNTSEIWERWKDAKDTYEYYYLVTRPNIFYKFYIFDTYFRKWDVVFYMDAGCMIHGPLERFKNTCLPNNCLYAHSNCYPSHEWKLQREFMFSIFKEYSYEEELRNKYNLDCDYFQSTILIYDTKIIRDNTVDNLYKLANKYIPKNDQGIMALYFIYLEPYWKQIPLKDEIGWLYDYHERGGYSYNDYCILKISFTKK